MIQQYCLSFNNGHTKGISAAKITWLDVKHRNLVLMPNTQ